MLFRSVGDTLCSPRGNPEMVIVSGPERLTARNQRIVCQHVGTDRTVGWQFHPRKLFWTLR